MPTIRRAASLPASPERVWQLVADPANRPRWWPHVVRVEEADARAWTDVLKAESGKAVRADMTTTASDPPRLLRWRQELAASPFERVLARAETEVRIAPEGSGARVTLVAVRRLRGMALFGGALVRRATRRQLTAALEGLERLVAGAGRS